MKPWLPKSEDGQRKCEPKNLKKGLIFIAIISTVVAVVTRLAVIYGNSGNQVNQYLDLKFNAIKIYMLIFSSILNLYHIFLQLNMQNT